MSNAMNVITGDNAMEALSDGKSTKVSNKFTYLKSGGKYTVKVPGINMISRYVYGSFDKNIYSFVAEKESQKSDRGFPTDDLTPFDKAWKYHKDLSGEWQDEHDKEAYQYIAAPRFTIGFYDLDSGEPIMVEFTRNQAAGIVETIKRYEARLDQFAFELTKTGKGLDTAVNLSLLPIMEDLKDTQQKNFKELPNEFEASNFEGLHYEMNEQEQIETLSRVGFDISLIGLEQETSADNEDEKVTKIADEDLPF